MLQPPHDCPTQTVGHTCAVLIARMYAFEFDNINHHANDSMFPLENSEAPNGDFFEPNMPMNYDHMCFTVVQNSTSLN